MPRQYFKKLREGLIFSLEGFRFALKETAFQMELLAGIPAILYALFSGHSKPEKAMLVFSICFILIVELFNTAIEKVVDRISTKHHPLSKKVKDIASCSVFVSVISALAIWGIICLL